MTRGSRPPQDEALDHALDHALDYASDYASDAGNQGFAAQTSALSDMRLPPFCKRALFMLR